MFIYWTISHMFVLTFDKLKQRITHMTGDKGVCGRSNVQAAHATVPSHISIYKPH